MDSTLETDSSSLIGDDFDEDWEVEWDECGKESLGYVITGEPTCDIGVGTDSDTNGWSDSSHAMGNSVSENTGESGSSVKDESKKSCTSKLCRSKFGKNASRETSKPLVKSVSSLNRSGRGVNAINPWNVKCVGKRSSGLEGLYRSSKGRMLPFTCPLPAVKDPKGEPGPVTKECSDNCAVLLGKKLLRASQAGFVKEVRQVLEEGADVNFTYDSDWSALHRAAAKGYPEIVSQLLRKGADTDARTSGYTALHLAAYNDQTGRCVFLLLAAGADPDATNHLGRTPLHFAAERGNEAAVRELLAAGADRAKTDRKGWAPADVARGVRVRRILHHM